MNRDPGSPGLGTGLLDLPPVLAVGADQVEMYLEVGAVEAQSPGSGHGEELGQLCSQVLMSAAAS